MKAALCSTRLEHPALTRRSGCISHNFIQSLAVMLGLLLCSAYTLAEPVAVVIRTSGEVARIATDDQRTMLARRDTLNVGDRIETGADAFITLRFVDQGLVDLGSDTHFVIQQYRTEAGMEGPNVLLELLEGKLRTVTGALARDPDDYSLITPNASIGIRGTEFEVWWQAETGTRARLTRGSVSLADRAGLGDPVMLTEVVRFGEVALASPATLLKEWPGESLGAFPDDLLNLQIPGILPPLAPALAPVILPLDADSPTPAVGTEQQNDSLSQFVQAVTQQDWSSARVLSRELLKRYEGTARFDFHYALLLIHENRTQEAIFALERVLTYVPDQHRARLELARAYFANNNLARSRTEFERVLATEPPTNVRTNINAYLERIAAAEQARKRQFNLFATFETGWNSNINSGSTLNGELAPNLLNLTHLSDSSKAIGSSYGQFRFGGHWMRPTSLQSGLTFGLQGQTTQYPDHQDHSQSGLNAHVRTNKVSEQLRSEFWLSTGYTWIDNEPWQLTLATGGQLTRPVWGPLWAGLVARSQVGFGQSEGSHNTVSDRLGIVLTAKEHQRNHNFSSEYSQLNLSGGDNGHLEWKGISNRYSLGWRWPKRLHTSFTVQHDWRIYQADDLLFTQGENSSDRKRRQDQFLMGDAALNWQARTWLRSRTGMRMEWLDSNINAYSRDQWVLSQSLTLTF